MFKILTWVDGQKVLRSLTPEEVSAFEAGALAAERATMKCSRAQGKMAIGADVWAQVEAMANDPATPWALKVAIYDTNEWNRSNKNMDALAWAMGLTPEQTDDLFRLAVTL